MKITFFIELRIETSVMNPAQSKTNLKHLCELTPILPPPLPHQTRKMLCTIPMENSILRISH